MKRLDLEKQVNLWVWLGRIAPLTSLLAIVLELTLDLTGWLDYLLIATAVSFGTVAFVWWWWVIYAVKDLNKLLDKQTAKFDHIIREIKSVKAELRKQR